MTEALLCPFCTNEEMKFKTEQKKITKTNKNQLHTASKG